MFLSNGGHRKNVQKGSLACSVTGKMYAFFRKSHKRYANLLYFSFQLNELTNVYDDVQDRVWEIEKVGDVFILYLLHVLKRAIWIAFFNRSFFMTVLRSTRRHPYFT